MSSSEIIKHLLKRKRQKSARRPYSGHGRAQGVEQCAALPLLGVGGLVEDAVGQELFTAARKAGVPVQEVQLRLALVVFCMITILQSSSSMRLIDEHLCQSSARNCDQMTAILLLTFPGSFRLICNLYG